MLGTKSFFGVGIFSENRRRNEKSGLGGKTKSVKTANQLCAV
jgi:hypothetical protein